MSEAVPTPRQSAPGLTWAIILISIGAIALLNNLGVLNVSLIDLIRFWPVVLILIGLDILLGRRSYLGSIASALISVLVLGGILWWASSNPTTLPLGEVNTMPISEPLGDAEAVDVELQLGVMKTRVTPLKAGTNVAEGEYRTNTDLDLTVTYNQVGSTGHLVVKQNDEERRSDFMTNFVSELDLGLSTAVPLDLKVDAGVGDIVLDLTQFDLNSLDIHGGVGNIEVLLPGAGNYTVKADMGVGNIEFTIPKTIEARVNFDGGIAGSQVPSRFASVGEDQWETAGYDSADSRVTLNIHSGVGNMSIHD